MSKHAAPKPSRPKREISPKPFLLTGAGVLALAMAVWLFAFGGLQALSAALPAFLPESPSAESETESSVPESSAPADSESDGSSDESGDSEPVRVSMPETELRGAWLCAGIDYDASGKGDEAAIRKELSAAIGKLKTWGFNAVLLPLQKDGAPLYAQPTGTEDTSALYAATVPFDPVAYASSLARAEGMRVYGVLDLSAAGDLTTAAGAAAAAGLAETAARAAAPDGVWLTGYTAEGSGDTGEYLAAGGGDRAAFVRQHVTAAVSAAASAWRRVLPESTVGLLAEPLWSDTQEGGCAVTGLDASYAKGADTRGWVTAGLFDAVMPCLSTAVGDKQADFAVLCSWWDALCKAQGVPLYVSQDVARRWSAPDQPAQQLLCSRRADTYRGSAFSSYAALAADRNGSTEALLKVYAGTVKSEYLTDTLVISDPSKTTFTTKESSLLFTGTADPNFPLTVDGREIALTERGFFSWNTTLKPGENRFTFSHKGKTVTYRVTYAVTVLNSVYPDKDLTLSGGSTLNISVVARKGASVRATVNGKTLTLKEGVLRNEEDATESLTDYAQFTASYTLPEGKIGKAQRLGNVRISATYAGLSASMTGGSITVEALPEPEPEPSDPSSDSTVTPGEFTPGDLISSPKMPDKLTAIDPASGGKTLGEGKIVVVTGNFAQTYKLGSPNMSRPEYAYLPRGTTDLVVGEVTDSSGKYYKLRSGRLLKVSRLVDKYENGNVKKYNVTVVDTLKSSGKITENAVTGTKVNSGGDYTVLYLGTTWRVPYDFHLLPQNYYNESNTKLDNDPSYTIRDQAAEYIDLKLYYTTNVPAAPDLSGSPLFSSAEWIKGDGAYTLRLRLRDKGAFYGYSAAWDEKGNLILAFRHPHAGENSEKPLSGMKVVLDPGHGGGYGRPVLAPGVQEHLQAMQFGTCLRDKLTALGATVVMTRETNDISPDLYDRADYARNSDTDLFISIHTNAANGMARGMSTFYYNLYSQRVAKLLQDYGSKTYKTFTGSDKYTTSSGSSYSFNRGTSWSPLNVTRLADCPAVLIECGFLDNAQDRELLTDTKFQQAFCDNLVEAIQEYYRTAPKHTTSAAGSPTTAATTAVSRNSAVSSAPTEARTA